MSHLGPHTSMRPHFSHAPKIGAGKQSACHCVHQVLQEEIGSFGPFTPVSAIFFLAVLFLMVSINICRVISTFITRAVFFAGWDFQIYAPPFWGSCAGNYGSSWLLSSVIDTDKMVWLPSCSKWLADITCRATRKMCKCVFASAECVCALPSHNLKVVFVSVTMELHKSKSVQCNDALVL